MAALLQNKLGMEYGISLIYFIKILEEVLSFYGYYELCNCPLSLLEQKKRMIYLRKIFRWKK